MRLFVDCDGVLADFEGGCQALLGMPSREFEAQHGAAAFWQRLAEHEDFYGQLPLMAGADQLVAAVQHLRPTILTGLPRGTWAEPQKRAWAERHFAGVPVITCWSARKHEHAQLGDVLIDDQARAGERWTAAGGQFVHHRSAEATIAALAALGVLALK